MNNKKRKIDSYGKLFLFIESKRNTTIYSISVSLKSKIKQKILNQAVNQSLNKFKDFKVSLKKGLFKYYLEPINNKIIIKEQSNVHLSKFNYKDNNGYLFRITYIDNKINFDFYHILTDGTGASSFVKEVIERYLDLLNNKTIKQEEIVYCTDGYKNNNKTKTIKGLKKKHKLTSTFLIKDKIKSYQTITNLTLNLQEIKKYCKKNDITITQYIAALITKSIYETNKEKIKNSQKIKISIPVNLRKILNYETFSNFFEYFNLNISKKEASLDIKKLLTKVKIKFKEELKPEYFIYKVRQNAKILNQKFTKVIPFHIKKTIAYFINSIFIPKSTVILSNIGCIKYSKKYSKYIDSTTFVSNAETKTIKCTVCSTNNKLSISFITNFKDILIEKKFLEFLKKNGFNVSVENSYT